MVKGMTLSSSAHLLRAGSSGQAPARKQEPSSGFKVPLFGVDVSLWQLFPAVVVLILGTALAITLALLIGQWQTDQNLDLYEIEGIRQLSSLKRGIEAFRPDNEALLSFMQLNPNATYAEFEHFASRMIEASALKGAQQALSYLPNTPNSRRAEFEREVCEQFCEVTGRTFDTMYIRNTSGLPEIPKDRYFAVHYIFPLETNLGAIMFDISSSAARNISINKAIETDDYQATPRITLVQEGESAGGSYGFLVIRPIFSLKETMQDGRMVLVPNPDILQGLKSIVVRVKELVESAAREANIPRIQIYLFDASSKEELGPLCTVSPEPRVCKPDFLHALESDTDASFTWSRGFRVVEGEDGSSDKVPWYTVEDVLGKTEGTIFIFEGEFDVFGRSWAFVMLGDPDYWSEGDGSLLLIIIVMIFTVFTALLMVSAARQAAINATLQEKDIARLKVITMQQLKDRIVSSAAEVRDVLKGMLMPRYPDGSEKQYTHIKPSKRAAALQQADGLAAVCVTIANGDAIASAPAPLNRAIQQTISEAFQEYLNKCHGLDASGLDGSGTFMALFSTTMDACAFVGQLLPNLTEWEWPEEVVQLPQCGEVYSEHGILLERGPRLQACVHWVQGEENAWGENAAGSALFAGAGRSLVFEVASHAAPGQVLITKTASDEQLGRSEDSDFLHMAPIGYHKVFDNIMLLSEVTPPPWDNAMPGLAATGTIQGLEKVGKPPRCLVGPPGISAASVGKEEEAGSPGNSMSVAGRQQTLTMVSMKFVGLSRKSPDATKDIEALVIALAQTYCGYVTPLQEESNNITLKAVFLSVVNAVRFSSSLQVALVNMPTGSEDVGMDQHKSSTSSVAMLISTINPWNFNWVPSKKSFYMVGRTGSFNNEKAAVNWADRRGSTSPRTSHDPRARSNSEKGTSATGRKASRASSSASGTIKGMICDGVLADRPFVRLIEDGRDMTVQGKDPTRAESLLGFVAQGQVIMCGETWEMAGALPDNTRPIYLGKYKLLPNDDSVQMIEIQTRGLQARKFAPLPAAFQLEEGFHEAPSGEDGIAYIMIQLKNPTKPGTLVEPIFSQAVEQLNALIRSLLKGFNGYECDYKDHGAFNLAFPTMPQAMQFAVAAQKRAMELPYSPELLDLKGCEEVKSPEGAMIFRGLRMKMGISFSSNVVKRPSARGRADYAGAFFNICAASVQVASPGQIMMDGTAGIFDENDNLRSFMMDEPGEQIPLKIEEVGLYHLKGVQEPIRLVSILHPALEGRMFSPPPGRVSQGVLSLNRPEAKRLQANRGNDAEHSAVNDSVTGMVQELMGKRMGWSDQMFKSDEVVEIQTIIGMGNYGKVYRGLWKGVMVAYKVIQYPEGTVGEQEQYKTTAIMETAISASMSHPNVVQTYSYDIKPIMGEAKGDKGEDTAAPDRSSSNPWENEQNSLAEKRFKRRESSKQQIPTENLTVLMWEVKIIQEYCSQGSLRKVLDDKTFWDEENNISDLSFVFKIAGDIARGMMHIHSMQIVHGDLKAHNILITETNGATAKVADFGLSIKMDTEQTHVSGVHAGTLTHMAPEILMSGHISKAADVYAFGILMYETLTAQKAFRGVPMHLISSKICSGRERPMFPPGCPAPYVQLAAQCWDHHQETRPTFAQVIEALDAMDAAHKKGELGNSSSKHLPPRQPAASHTMSIPEEDELSSSVMDLHAINPVIGGTTNKLLDKLKKANEGFIPLPGDLSGSYYFEPSDAEQLLSQGGALLSDMAEEEDETVADPDTLSQSSHATPTKRKASIPTDTSEGEERA